MSLTPLPTQYCLFALNLSYIMKRMGWNAQSLPSFDLNTIQTNFCWVCSYACLLDMGWELCKHHADEKECFMRAESKHSWAPAENSQARGGLPSSWRSLWTSYPYRFDICAWRHTLTALIQNPSSERCSSHSVTRVLGKHQTLRLPHAWDVAPECFWCSGKPTNDWKRTGRTFPFTTTMVLIYTGRCNPWMLKALSKWLLGNRIGYGET